MSANPRQEGKISQDLLIDTILAEPSIFSAISTKGDLVAEPEYQILQIIASHESISSESINKKLYEDISLSMSISNLRADNLIEKTENDNWALSSFIRDLLQKNRKIVDNRAQVEREIQEQKSEERQQNLLKMEYKLLADVLIKYDFVPKNTKKIDELFAVPELEILQIIKDRQPITSEDIESFVQFTPSVSMTLSNLQIDGLIEQDTNYQWQFTRELNDRLSNSGIIQSEFMDGVTSEEVQQSGLSHEETEILAHRQLLKTMDKRQYFTGSSIQDMVSIPEFQILNVIHMHGPINTSDIDSKLSVETSLTLVLSNLQADDLINQIDDNWILSEELRRDISRITVSREEIKNELARESSKVSTETENPLEDSEIQPTSGERQIGSPDHDTIISNDITSSREEFISEIEPKEEILNPYIQTLVRCGYIEDSSISEHKLDDIPEYQLLRIIENKSPISVEKIGELFNTSSLALLLSNLNVDGLIEQNETNEYRLTLTFIKEIRPTYREIHQTHIENTKIQPMDMSIEKLTRALKRAGYISQTDIPYEELQKIPEFEILKTLADYVSLGDEELKGIVSSLTPVHITRILTRMEADGHLQNISGKWTFSKEFILLINYDDLQARARDEEETHIRLEKERLDDIRSQEHKLQQLPQFLFNEGILPSEMMSEKELLEFPEFVLLRNLIENGPLSTKVLKEKCDKLLPIMVSRSITQLEASGKIIALEGEKWDLSESTTEKLEL